MKGLKILIVILALVVIGFVVMIVVGATKKDEGTKASKDDTSRLESFAAVFTSPLERARLGGSEACLQQLSGPGAKCVLSVKPGGKFKSLALEVTDNSEVTSQVIALDDRGLPKGPGVPEGKMKPKEVKKTILSSPAAQIILTCKTPDPSTKRCSLALR